jgi:predicted transcriptional regulator YdeE
MRLRFAVATILLLSAAILGEVSAPRKVHETQFFVVGIEARTTNAKETTGNGVIPKQWQKFFQDRVAERIPNRADENFYAVYTDYASDRNGEYSFVIGVKVRDQSSVPAGMVLKTIPGGDYAVITSDKGPVAKVVPAAWQEIYRLEDNGGLGGKRAYKADYELYDQRATNPQASQVDIHVGLN